jgi:hypothetical protein
VAALVVACATVTWERNARAEDLRDVVSKIRTAWSRPDVQFVPLESKFLFDDESTIVILPAGAPGACRTLVAAGHRGMGLELRATSGDKHADEDEASRFSSAGIGVMKLPCDGSVRRVILTSHSGRGGIELLLAEHKSALPPLDSIVPERSGTEAAAQVDVGAHPQLPEAPARIEAYEREDARAGFRGVGKKVLRVAAGNSFHVTLELEPGCHVLRLVGTPVGKNRRRLVDLDVEASNEDGVVLARDRSDSADAKVDLCIGEREPIDLTGQGLPLDVDVTMMHAFVSLPPSLPAAWGEQARAHMVDSLRTRHLPIPADAAVFETQGGPQVTRVSSHIVPGACYVAVAVPFFGSVRKISIRAFVALEEHIDERSRGSSGAAIGFCAGTRDLVNIEVEARGAQVMWGLALFNVSGMKGK